MDVSIIIINYKTPGLVRSCLSSIFALSHGFTFDVFIVDNSCNTNDFLKLNETVASFPFVKVINGESNLGTSKANNLGAKVSDGDYLCFLNSDTRICNNAIYEMLLLAKMDHSIGAVGADLFNKNSHPTHSYLLNENTTKRLKKENFPFSFILSRLGKNKEFNSSNKPIEIRGYICLAAELVSRDCFFAVGGFDEDIFMYSEDALFGHRLQEKGYKQFCTPRAKIIHLEGGSDSDSFSEFKISNIVNGSFLFHLKAFGRKDALKYLELMYKSLRKRARRNRVFQRKVLSQNCRRLSEAYFKKWVFEKGNHSPEI